MFEKLIEHITEAALPEHFCLNLLDNPMRSKLHNISKKWDKNRTWRIPSVAYTLEHKLAFLATEHYLTGHYSLRGILHDGEKPFLYMIPGLNERQVQKIHRYSRPHHAQCEDKRKRIEHFFEMYIDWACAAITKPDKPLDAFETLVHFYPELTAQMLPICIVLEPERIRSQIFIHDWHSLALDEKHNREIIAEIKKILFEILNGDHPHETRDMQTLFEDYLRNGEINYFNANALFLLALYKQSQNLGKEIDFEALPQHLTEVYKRFENQNVFVSSASLPMQFNYHEIKPNVLMKA